MVRDNLIVPVTCKINKSYKHTPCNKVDKLIEVKQYIYIIVPVLLALMKHQTNKQSLFNESLKLQLMISPRLLFETKI